MNEYWCQADDWLYRQAGLPPIAEWPWFQIAVFVVSAIALPGAVKLWLHPPTFEQAKWWGIDRRNYACIRPLARLAVIEAALSAALAIVAIAWPAMMPLPFDIFVFLVLLFGLWLLYRSLCSRETFKHRQFNLKVLAPLGLSFVVALPGGARALSASPKAVSAIGKAAGLENIPKNAGRFAEAVGGKQLAEVADELWMTARGVTDDAIEWVTRKVPKEVDARTVSGPKRFVSRTALGGVGEAVTVRHYEDMGLKYFKSQVGSKGIDAVFAKFNKNGDLLEVYVVETKVNGSRLSLGQMADEWIRNGCKQAKKNNDARQAAELVEKALDPASGVVLHRHLMHVVTETGAVTRYSVATTGELATKQWAGNASEVVAEVIAKMEEKASCRALPHIAGVHAL